MPLNSQQFGDLFKALLNSFDENKLTLMVRLKLGFRLSDKVDIGKPFESIVMQLIDLFEYDDGIPKLIEAAMEYHQEEENTENSQLAAFLEKYSSYADQPSAVGLDPYQTCYVRASRLFINRDNLRAAVQQLRENDDAPRTFLVKGDAKTGKTYTRQLFSYLEDKPIQGRNEKHRTIYIDLKSYLFSPSHVAETIGRRLVPAADTNNIPSPAAEQEPAYIWRLLDWIHQQIGRTSPQTVWWIVFDHFLKSNLETGTKELAEQLVLRVENELREKCRVVILDYENNVPQNIVKQSICETVEAIRHDHLAKYLINLFALKSIVKTEEEINLITDEIIKQVDQKVSEIPNGAEQRGDILYEAVSEAVRRYVPAD